MSIMDDVINGFKFIFPKPIIPQKRYIVALGLILYYALKIYTASTPTHIDDNLPDYARDVFMHIAG